MAKFQKKPVVIEAEQFLPGDGVRDGDQVTFHGHVFTVLYGDADPLIEIETPEGTMRACYGDWIIRGVQGEFYPCKPDIFAQTYEPVDPKTGER